MKGKIRVFCRLRPPSEMERREGGCRPAAEAADECSVALETGRGRRTFDFDRVFGPDASQEAVFEDTKVRGLPRGPSPGPSHGPFGPRRLEAESKRLNALGHPRYTNAVLMAARFVNEARWTTTPFRSVPPSASSAPRSLKVGRRSWGVLHPPGWTGMRRGDRGRL